MSGRDGGSLNAEVSVGEMKFANGDQQARDKIRVLPGND